MMKKNLIPSLSLFLALLLPASFSLAQSPEVPALQEKVDAIVRNTQADVGVAIESIGSGDKAAHNAGKPFPMQSVYKFPIALALLDSVDKGRLKLDDPVFLTPADLLPDTHSPLREKYPEGNVSVTLREILTDTVTLSDNNGCDILLRLLGGPEAVDRYIKGLGITGMEIAATEAEMHRFPEKQFSNTATPAAANRLLRLFYQRKLLKPSSQELLWKLMENTLTGPGRLREPLPAGTALIHKTGTGDVSPTEGTTVNDIGIIMLPNGQPVLISVFITGARDSILETEKTIAALAKAAWEQYVAPPPKNPLSASQYRIRELFRLDE